MVTITKIITTNNFIIDFTDDFRYFIKLITTKEFLEAAIFNFTFIITTELLDYFITITTTFIIAIAIILVYILLYLIEKVIIFLKN